MYASSGQFWIFLLCLSYGIISGVILGLITLFTANKKVLMAVFDVLFFILSAVGFVFYSYFLNFTELRAYMIIGVIIGMIMYYKSFHITLANLIKKVYNLRKRKEVKNRERREI